MKEAVRTQRDYYARTAARYDAMHLGDPEQRIALDLMLGLLDTYAIGSILDVGSGTGRVLRQVAARRPDIRLLGIEPVAELREQGYAQGIPRDVLVAGDGYDLPFAASEFDLVCEFGVLHHVSQPRRMVAEMLRVARKGVFLSDSNNFGQGHPVVRAAKQGLAALGLWPLANWLKTRGKGYSVTDGDGVSYSYSLFTDYDRLRDQCATVHLFNTSGGGPNLYRTSPHVAMMGIKHGVARA